MKKLTVEEKLNIAIDFIKTVERYTPTYYQTKDVNGNCITCADKDEIEKLKDRAWHILAELT